jgi:hypothetical protein
MNDDNWRGWKNGKHDNRYRGVKRHSGQSSTKRIVIVLVVICALIGGYFVFQTYGSPQTIQNEANKIIQNTGNTIQQISSQSQKSISNLQNNVTSSINEDNRMPIAVYNDCHSTLRSDQKIIATTCNLNAPQYQKQFTFNMPDALEQALYNQVPLWVKTNVYQYGEYDFKIGLFDQVGEKNYTVTLWQFPK